MDEDTLDASSAVRSDNEIATIEEQSVSRNYIIIKRESKKKDSKTTKANHSIKGKPILSNWQTHHHSCRKALENTISTYHIPSLCVLAGLGKTR